MRRISPTVDAHLHVDVISVLRCLIFSCPFLSLCRNKIKYPSAERNKPFILEVLKKHFRTDDEDCKVLEIASGTGQHVSYFAEQFPTFTFQPTEYDTNLLRSIEAYANDTPTKNVKPPIFVDVTTDCLTWNLQDTSYDYMINVNMMHISPYRCTLMLFKNAGKLLKRDGLLITYGPYARDGILTPQSNVDFDRNLRAENPDWGVRDINDLIEIAKSNEIYLKDVHDLPANNNCLVWIKRDD